MTSIIARNAQARILQNMIDSEESEFLALYGRRRVGKTHLIRTFFGARNDCIFFDVAGTKDAPMREQIDHFVKRIGEIFYAGAKLKAGKNWSEVFSDLTDTLGKQQNEKNIILFFDEFPWMATKNSRLLQSLDYFWNQYWSKSKKIKLIICGSSASWIINKIVNNKGGLHNRITRHIQLEPFTLIQTQQFLKGRDIQLNHQQITDIYMVTGGVPYYLLGVERGFSAAQTIEQLAFKRNARLFDEFEKLFSSLFDDYKLSIDIVRFVAQFRYGVSKERIFEKIGKHLKGKRGLALLQSLEDVSFMTSYRPFGHKRKGTYYRITDEYISFYLQWIEPVKNLIGKQSLEDGYWQIQKKLPKWQSWSGYAFESICYKHYKQIKHALKLTPMDLPYTWSCTAPKYAVEQGAQLDLLFDREDGAITICEIKFCEKPFSITKEYAGKLIRKMDVFEKHTRTQKQLFLVMLVAQGLNENQYSRDLVSQIVTLKDLFTGE